MTQPEEAQDLDGVTDAELLHPEEHRDSIEDAPSRVNTEESDSPAEPLATDVRP